MDTTSLVVGAGRGLGRGIADALAGAGSQVVAVSRTGPPAGHPGVRAVTADATEDGVAGRLLDRYEPDALILVAGAAPAMLPLHEHTWETFSVNWQTDVRIAFHWLRAALRRPLRPGGRIVVLSSGAALAGSPLSGGYAGAKATQRFITGYARDEAARAGLDLTITAVLPRLTPLTGLGRAAAEAYADRDGAPREEYLRGLGDPLTPQHAGAAVLELLTADAATVAAAYLLTADGLRPLP